MTNIKQILLNADLEREKEHLFNSQKTLDTIQKQVLRHQNTIKDIQSKLRKA